MTPTCTRRELLVGAGAAALGLALGRLAPRARAAGVADAAGDQPSYGGHEDVWRAAWRWDRVVRGTHLRANCTSGCSWDVYVKDGIAWREEQADVYDATAPGIPDFGPRGCQKGACYSALMYGPSRVLHPLRRVGPRGSGQWKRISWDEALGEIADRVLDVCVEDGPGHIVYDFSNIDFGPSSAAELRFFSLLGVPTMDGLAGGGDLPIGAIQTWGLVNVDGSADDWFHADLILVWSMNPSYTRIPEIHFAWAARYRGARVVSIAPDYNATTMHADLWLNPRVETDAALALGMAHVLVEDGLYRADYVREQTDLPFLVRADTRRFLRQSDVQAGGKDDVFYVWDELAGEAVEAPGSLGHPVQSLRLRRGRLLGAPIRPALAGRFRVTLADGHTVEVRPVLELLREHLAAFSPERAGAVTGVGAETIRRTARLLAEARAALILASFGSCKHYHSDLMQRAMILLLALTGNQGKPGAGLRLSAMYSLHGFEALASGYEMGWLQRLALAVHRPSVRTIEHHMRKAAREERGFYPSTLWLWHHAGMADVLGRPEWGDPALPRPPAAYVDEAMRRGWMPLWPAPGGRPPRIYFSTCSNPLRRCPAPQRIEAHAWSKLDLAVTVDFRMSTTALRSDLVLPAAGYYEKRGIKYAQSYVPYVVFGDQAVPPLGDSRGEWEIYGRLAEKVEERARARGIQGYRGVFDEPRDPGTLYAQWSGGGRFSWQDDRPALDYILERSAPTPGVTWEDARTRGAVRIRATGMYGPGTAICTDFREGETIWPSGWFVEEKEPWPTLTGRQQFYLDHAWFLEAGEALPTHKEAPAAGGDYPLRMTGGHTRWSIHAIWRDQAAMLALQRGGPVLYMNGRDAARRGLADGARARVRNDLGSFETMVKTAPGVQPGQVVIYHAWEPYQFPGWRGSQEVVPSPLKPLHLVGDYGHLQYRMYYASPGYTPRGTRVEVEPMGA